MWKSLVILPAVLVLLSASYAFAGPEEDLAFAEGLFKRKWYDWAEEAAVKVVENPKTPSVLRGWAAQLHLNILDALARETGDESYREKAKKLARKYKKIIPAGDTEAKFAQLHRKLLRAQDLAAAAQVEPDGKKRTALRGQACRMFEELDSQWEALVSDLRDEVAKYPPEEQWPGLKEKLTPRQYEQFLNTVWRRNSAEYLYASMFVYWSKVAPEEKRKQILERGLKKFNRFTDGEMEHDKDFDPPARGEIGGGKPAEKPRKRK
jgi:hypothetical protein